MCPNTAPRRDSVAPSRASSGMPAAQASNSALSGARSASSAKATSSARRSSAHSAGRGSPIVSTAFSYSSESVRSDTVVSSVLSVTGTPARCRRASGCAPRLGTIPACQFEVGQRSRVTRRAVRSRQSDGSSAAPGPWAIRSGSISSARRTCAAPPHSPACRVIRRPPARAASNARAWVSGSGKAASGPARSHAGQAAVAEAGRGLGELDVRVRVVGSQRRADQPDRRPRARRGLGRARRRPPRSRRPGGRPPATCSSGPQRIST